MAKRYKDSDIVKMMQTEADKTSGAAVARSLGLTRGHIGDILAGRRRISATIAMAYGFDRHEKPAEVWFTKQETY